MRGKNTKDGFTLGLWLLLFPLRGMKESDTVSSFKSSGLCLNIKLSETSSLPILCSFHSIQYSPLSLYLTVTLYFFITCINNWFVYLFSVSPSLSKHKQLYFCQECLSVARCSIPYLVKCLRDSSYSINTYWMNKVMIVNSKRWSFVISVDVCILPSQGRMTQTCD